MVQAMSTSGFTGTQFQSAVHRRSGKGPMLRIAHWVYDGDEDEVGREVVHDLMIDPRLDVIRFGEMFGTYGNDMKAVNEAMKVDTAEGMSKLAGVVAKGVHRLRDCIVPTHRKLLDEVSDAIDVQMMTSIIQWVAAELSPVDPTQPASSPDGSVATSETSTDGVPPAA